MSDADRSAVAFRRGMRSERPPEIDPIQQPSTAPPRRDRRRTVRRVAVGFCGAVAIAAVSLGGWMWWEASSAVSEFQAGPKKPIVEAVTPELGKAPRQPTPGIPNAMTIVAVGSDNRPWEQRGRSDTVLVVRVDPTNETVSMLSLPRDLLVPIPGHGSDRINAAYSYGGVKLLVATLREYLGVRIDHFVQVDFKGFADTVSELGGVWVPVDGRYLHVNDGQAANNWASINLQPGYQRLGREDALNWVRFRHLDSDFYRAARQQLFLREVGRQLRERTSDPLAMRKVLRTVAKATTSDLHGVVSTARLANTLRTIGADRVTRVTMQADSAPLNGVAYLQASSAQRHQALMKWAHPLRNVKRQAARHTTVKRRTASTPAAVVSDAGRGLALVRPLRGLRRCAPTELPIGYHWGDQSPARRYTLNGRPAIAAWATRGSGRSVLWMWTTWDSPPILRRDYETVRRAGRTYRTYWESGELRMVSWRVGQTNVWVTNTLRNELSPRVMMALATTCRPVV